VTVVRELPAFAVRSAGLATLAGPVRATGTGLGLVSGSFGAGLLVMWSAVSEVDPNPRELIYELGTWG